MHIVKRIGVLCLSLLILMMTTVQAENALLVHSAGWDLMHTPVEVLIKADVNTHMPFDDDRLAMLTPITDMLSLRLIAGENEGLVTIAIDQYDVLTLQYRGNEAQLSSMPDTTYAAETDPMGLLLGADISVSGGYEALGLARESETLVKDGAELLKKLPEHIQNFGKRSKNTTNIVGYGKAAYRYDYTISAAKATEWKEMLLSACPEGWLRGIIGGLTFSGKQTLRVYYTEEDALLRAEYNGSCGPEGDLRTVKLIYKTCHNEKVDKDYIELTSPAKKGKNKNSLTFERTIGLNEQGQPEVTGNFNYTVTADGVTSIRKGDFDLKNAFTETADFISGHLTIETKLNDAEKYSGITITPDLQIAGFEASPTITGTLTVVEEYAGKTTEHAVLSIDLKKAGVLEWVEQSELIDLSALTEVELAEIRQDVSASIATAIVHPLIVMMGAEAEWFFRELPADAVQNIIDTAETTVN